MRKPDLNDPKYDDSPGVPDDVAVARIVRYQDDMQRWYSQAGRRLLEVFLRKGIVRTPAFWGGFNVLHRSTKVQGRYQLTFFDEQMEPWGDTEDTDPRVLIKRMLQEIPARRATARR